MQASIRQDPTATHLTLDGDLTEDFQILTVAEALDGPLTPLTIDLAGVRRINSAGVREWIRFVGALGPGRPITLARCPAAFIRQAGMIKNFLGGAVVESLYVPYLCPRCEASRTELVEAAALAGHSFPEARCEACAVAMEADVVPEAFLAFLEG